MYSLRKDVGEMHNFMFNALFFSFNSGFPLLSGALRGGHPALVVAGGKEVAFAGGENTGLRGEDL